MTSQHRQFHIPLSEEQHKALEQHAQALGVSKAEAVRLLLAQHVKGFDVGAVKRRGTYVRKPKQED